MRFAVIGIDKGDINDKTHNIGDHGTVRDHQEHHVEHEGESGTIDGITDRKLFALHFGITDTAAGNTDQSGNRNAEDSEKRCLAAHVILDLQPDIGADSHTDGNGEGEAADALGEIFCGGSTSPARVMVAEPQTE